MKIETEILIHFENNIYFILLESSVTRILHLVYLIRKKRTLLLKVKSSMARSLPVENLLPQNAGSIINYLQ